MDLASLEKRILEIKTGDDANTLLDELRDVEDTGVRQRLGGMIRDAMKKLQPAGEK